MTDFNQGNDKYFGLQINFIGVSMEYWNWNCLSLYGLLPHGGLLQPITLVCHLQTPAQPSALMFFLYHSAHPQSVQLDPSICIENYCQTTEAT